MLCCYNYCSFNKYSLMCTSVSSLCLNFAKVVLTVPDPVKGVCADPVNRGAILEVEGPGPPSGDKERQLSPDMERGKT